MVVFMHEISTDITSDHNTILPYKTSKGKLNSYIRGKSFLLYAEEKKKVDTTCQARLIYIKIMVHLLMIKIQR